MTKLITPGEAAKLAHVSRETIQYWVKTGRLAKHPYPLSQKSKQIHKRDFGSRRFLLSRDEVLSNGTGSDLLKIRKKFPDLNLVTTREAANAVYLTKSHTLKLVRELGVTKYYYERGVEFLVDLDELKEKFAKHY